MLTNEDEENGGQSLSSFSLLHINEKDLVLCCHSVHKYSYEHIYVLKI